MNILISGALRLLGGVLLCQASRRSPNPRCYIDVFGVQTASYLKNFIRKGMPVKNVRANQSDSGLVFQIENPDKIVNSYRLRRPRHLARIRACVEPRDSPSTKPVPRQLGWD
jgi:hypothetical protein